MRKTKTWFLTRTNEFKRDMGEAPVEYTAAQLRKKSLAELNQIYNDVWKRHYMSSIRQINDLKSKYGELIDNHVDGGYNTMRDFSLREIKQIEKILEKDQT